MRVAFYPGKADDGSGKMLRGTRGRARCAPRIRIEYERLQRSVTAVLIAGYLAILAGVALLECLGRPAAIRTGPGLVLLALAAAATGAVSGDGGAPENFLQINGGLTLVGACLCARYVWMSVQGGRPSERGVGTFAAESIGAMAILAGSVLSVASLFPVGRRTAVAALAAAGILGVVGWGSVRWLDRFMVAIARYRRSDTHDRPASGGRRSPRSNLDLGLGALAAASATVSLIATDLAPVFAGAIAAAFAAHSLMRRAGKLGWFPLLPFSSLGLVPIYGLLHTIAGPVGLRLSSLTDVPLSAAAQSLLAPALLVASWGFFGLWPWRPGVPGPWLSGIGVALLIRVGGPALPDGLAEFRTLAVLAAVIGIWAGGLAGRTSAVAAGGALLGAVIRGPDGVTGATWLSGAALVLSLDFPAGGRVNQRWLTPVVRVSAVLAGGWGGLLVTRSGLGAETVLTTLGALGAAMGFGIAAVRSVDPVADTGAYLPP